MATSRLHRAGLPGVWSKPTVPLVLDRADGLMAGINDFYVFQPGRTAHNLANPGLVATRTSNATIADSPHGPGAYGTGGASFDVPNATSTGIFASASVGWTVRCVVYIKSWPGNFAALIDKGTGTREFSIFFNTSGAVNFVGNLPSTPSPNTSFTAGGVYDFCITGLGGSPFTQTWYINGRLNNTTTWTNTAQQSAGFALGRNSSGGGVNADAVFLLFQTWTRTLTATDVAALYSNRYRGARPLIQPFVQVGVAGGGGTTFNDSFTESVTVTDSLAVAATFRPSYTETTTVTDSLGTVTVTFRPSYTETVTVTDSLAVAGTFLNAFTETVTLTDSATGGNIFVESLTESVTLSDSLTAPVFVFNASFSETITVTDSLSVSGGSESTSIWSPVSAANGSWSGSSAAGGTWTPVTPATGTWT